MQSESTWDPSYSVGNDLMDQHHQKLMLLCHRADECAGKADAPSLVEFQKILTEVSEYSLYHFAAEEALLRTHNYSDFAGHVDEHERLYDQVTDLLFAAAADSPEGARLGPVLRDWIKVHILQHDMQYKYIFARPIE